MHAQWQTTRFKIDLTTPKIMGIVNVTPDSFFDGGRYAEQKKALQQCEQLLAQGADILDIGAESSRPNSAPAPLEQELDRVLPVVKEALKLNVPLSVDTYKPQVMQQVLELGVDIVNDIYALRQDGAKQVIRNFPTAGVCLIHMHRNPQTMQLQPMQGNVVEQVINFFQQLTDELISTKIATAAQLVLDPGIGFGKTVEQNFSLLSNQKQLNELNFPWLVGWSRKSSLGAVTGLDVEQRLIPSVAAALLAADRGAAVVRVHDVAATKQALQVWAACQK